MASFLFSTAQTLAVAMASPPAWEPVDWVLGNATEAKVFPGAVALVGNSDGTLYTSVFGNYTNDGRDPPFRPPNAPSDPNPVPTLDDTRFDMASCTKVVATTSAVGLLYQRGFLRLEDPVHTYLGPEYASQGKDNVTILNCLLHNAGYPPDPNPEYWDPEFGCQGRSSRMHAANTAEPCWVLSRTKTA